MRSVTPLLARLLEVAPGERDAWIDRELGIRDVPPDGPDLPRGGVPYLPARVESVLRVIEHAPVTSRDVVLDLGSGAGRAAVLFHLLTGASVVGIEIQREMVAASRALVARLGIPPATVSFVEGDAAELAGTVGAASVVFLYCPFSGERLARALASLEPLARRRSVAVSCVDLLLPPCAWLAEATEIATDVVIYRS